MTEVKQCECGGKAETAYIFAKNYNYKKMCTKCGKQTGWHNTEAEAIEAWNRREGEK